MKQVKCPNCHDKFETLDSTKIYICPACMTKCEEVNDVRKERGKRGN